MNHVAIFMPVLGDPHPCNKWSVAKQRFDGKLDVIVHPDSQDFSDPDPIRAKFLNCSNARNTAKRKALETKAEWFLSLDADVSIQSDCVQTFFDSVKKIGPSVRPGEEGRNPDCLGGWYPQKGNDRWVAGVSGEGNFTNYTMPRKRKFSPTNLVPLGCCFLHRSILELTEFRPGYDENHTTVDSLSGNTIYWGECLEFGNQLMELGSACFMHPKIICQHW